MTAHRRASGSPTPRRSRGRGVVDRVQLSLVEGAADHAPRQGGRPPHAGAANDLGERLALWLADVSAEALLAASESDEAPAAARLEPAS